MDIESNSKSKLDSNFLDIIQILKKHKINYWLCHGTLLGIIRDQNLIEWDHDIDIAVWDEMNLKDKFKSIMIANHYEIKKKYLVDDDLLTFKKKGGREVDINFYHIKKINSEEIAYVKWFVPKNFLCKLIDALSMSSNYKGKFMFLINKFKLIEPFFIFLKKKMVNKKIFYKNIGYTQPYYLLKKIKNINFKNIEVSVPDLSEDYLKYIYGNNWQIPKKNYNWIKDSPSTKDI